MTPKNYALLAAVIFTIVALVQLSRPYWGSKSSSARTRSPSRQAGSLSSSPARVRGWDLTRRPRDGGAVDDDHACQRRRCR
jgi:hypothetical protein